MPHKAAFPPSRFVDADPPEGRIEAVLQNVFVDGQLAAVTREDQVIGFPIAARNYDCLQFLSHAGGDGHQPLRVPLGALAAMELLPGPSDGHEFRLNVLDAKRPHFAHAEPCSYPEKGRGELWANSCPTRFQGVSPE